MSSGTLYTVQEVANIVGRERAAVLRWIKNGKLKTEKEYHSSLVYHKILGAELILFANHYPKHLKRITPEGVAHWVEEGSRNDNGHLVFAVQMDSERNRRQL